MTEDLFEKRLSATLKAVSALAIPDGGTCAPMLGDWDPLSDDAPALTDTSLKRRVRVGGWARKLTVAALVFGVAGVGAGVAAAAGLFSTTVGTELIAPAKGQLSPSGAWTAAHVVTRIIEPGPDGSTISLQTSSSNAHNGCFHLLVTGPTEPAPGPTAPTGPGIVSCGEVFNAAHPWTTTTPSTTFFGSGTQPWRSPTGTSYVIVYGQAPAGTTSAKLIDTSTGAVVTGDVDVSDRFYAYPVPQRQAHDKVVFYSAAGNEVGTASP